MQELKKTFARPEAEIVKFEKTDVIATSGTGVTVVTGTGSGPAGGMPGIDSPIPAFPPKN